MLICNAISLNMVSVPAGQLIFRQRSNDEARSIVEASGAESAIGHADTAAVVGAVLGVPLPAARVTVCLQPQETILVAQYRGPRLPEGATTLPEGAEVVFFSVTLASSGC